MHAGLVENSSWLSASQVFSFVDIIFDKPCAFLYVLYLRSKLQNISIVKLSRMRKLLFAVLLCTLIKTSKSQLTCTRAAKLQPSRCVTPCNPPDGCSQPKHDCLCDGQCGYSCVPRSLSCGAPPRVRFAVATASGTRFNDTVVYKCQAGYTVIGEVKKRCNAKGNWGGALPVCMQVCTVPKKLPFGAYIRVPKKSNKHYQTGQSIILGCKKGFRQTGTDRWFCIGGKWTNFPFKCIATHSCRRTIRAAFTRCTKECSPYGNKECSSNSKCLCDGQCGYSCVETGLSCGVPPIPENGVRFLNGTGYNDTVRYKCNNNYTVQGNSVRRCTAKKTWEGMYTSCLPNCPKPHRIPPNAYIENEKERYASGDRVKFKCNKGYHEEGLATTMCFLGNWNIMPFKCTKGSCGDPGVPANGNKVGILYGVSRKVFFTCKLGYEMIGSQTRTCGVDIRWSGKQPLCRIIDCGPMKPLKNGTIIGNDTTFFKTLTFRCDPGFELIGLGEAVCQSDKRWSNTATCNPVDCGSLDAPLHGTKIITASTYPNNVVFRCHDGYMMDGSSVRTCFQNASWSGKQPTCTAVSCGILSVPKDGSRKGNRWTFPNSVSFTCDVGFDLIGAAVRICQGNGTWSGALTQCRDVDCGKYAVPMNGTTAGKSTKYKATVEVRCDPGFIVKGPRYRHCQADGTWSGKPANCDGVDCGKIASPKSGTTIGTYTRYPAQVEVRCDPGFILKGSRYRHCQADGRWSGRPATCDDVDCGKYAVPMNGTTAGKSTKYKATVELRCDPGFILKGPRYSHCQADGTWSGKPANCDGVDCGTIASPKSGTTIGAYTRYPAQVEVRCDAGFILKGSRYRHCQADGRWSGRPASCDDVDCGKYTVPMNGTAAGKSTKYRATVEFRCDPGFILNGPRYRHCQANGTWSGKPAKCDGVDCGKIASPKSGTTIGSYTIYPAQVEVRCDAGFILKGSRYRHCQADGRWSGRPASCDEGSCGDPGVPANGNKVGISYGVGRKLFFTCKLGYEVVGSQTRTCGVDIRWSGKQPRCRRVDCGKIASPKSGTTIGAYTIYPAQVEVRCDAGFILKGSRYRHCQADGRWSGRPASCDEGSCGDPGVPANGNKFGISYGVGRKVFLTCNLGYEMVGSQTRTCGVDIRWSGKQLRCRPVDCRPMKPLKNGTIIGTETTIFKSLTFRCDHGFELIGPLEAVCQSDRRWSNTATCNLVDCGPMKPLNNGTIIGNETTFFKTLTFRCDPGFELIGPLEAVCQSNKRWSNTATCNARDCGLQETPMHGIKTGTLTTFPNRIDFKCDNGFLLIGSKSRTCQANGKWSGEKVMCRAALYCKRTEQAARCTKECSPYGNSECPSNSKCLCDGQCGYSCVETGLSCGVPPTPENGFWIFNGTGYNDTVRYKCKENYTVQGNSVRRCTAKKTWEGIAASCLPDCVRSYPIPPNAYIENKKERYESGDRVTLKCNKGYHQEGLATTMCFLGNWNVTPFKCKQVDCGTFHIPLNGIIIGWSTTHSSNVTFRCYDGYRLKGSAYIVCQTDGTWSGEKTMCINCKRALGMRSGRINNHRLSSSSERDSRHSAHHGRLRANSAWCNERNDNAPYFQVDFGRAMDITSVATQGHPNEYNWIHKYYLKYTMGTSWFTYSENGKIKVFKGNRNRNTIVKHGLAGSLIAKRVRIYQHKSKKEFRGTAICLRAEFYGCPFRKN